MTLRCDKCGTVYGHREDHKCVVVHAAPMVVHDEAMVVHTPDMVVHSGSSRHGAYADMDARREYRREWMRARRARGEA